MKKERNGDERGRETRTKRKGKKGGPLFFFGAANQEK